VVEKTDGEKIRYQRVGCGPIPEILMQDVQEKNQQQGEELSSSHQWILRVRLGVVNRESAINSEPLDASTAGFDPDAIISLRTHQIDNQQRRLNRPGTPAQIVEAQPHAPLKYRKPPRATSKNPAVVFRARFSWLLTGSSLGLVPPRFKTPRDQ
jgi:hypothetical protein